MIPSFPPLPESVAALDIRCWESFQPYYDELKSRPITADSPPEEKRAWLKDWSDLSRFLGEAITRIYIEKSLDTTDEAKEEAFLEVINNVVPPARIAEQLLKEKLLALEVADADMALVLRDMRNEADLFREENVPLQTELEKLSNEYDKVTGGMKTEWDGEEKNLSQLRVLLKERERPVRERAWRAMMDLWLGGREEINQIYVQMLDLRQQVAANAGLPDYRAYAFRDMGRFDYTPEDCFLFHDAIEQVVVPAAERVLARRQERLGLARLRPWDTEVEPGEVPPLKPYQGADELIAGTISIFEQVDPQLGGYVRIMAGEKLLDLDTRPGKALGGYCSYLPWQGRPFIFMNGAGIHDDVQTMLHEAGHAFHDFEAQRQPLIWQLHAPMEFSEVASMSMELLAAPYLTQARGGFYSDGESARARIEHLEGIILFLPYMAVVDAFQHWVYTHIDEAKDPANLDATWDRLWARFMTGVDWSGLEDERVTGWHRKLHIFDSPFYYIEYGMAQVGALQVWCNSLSDQAGALKAYRGALSLGGTRTLPELFEAAGAEFRFDTAMLSELVALVEETVVRLEGES